MARYSGAIWDPLGKQTQPRMRAHNIWCAHTMAGSLEGTRAMFKRDGYGGTESHFGLGGSGKLYQWQDTEFTADANFHGNPEVISIETADMGEDFPSWGGSDVPKWTDDQLEVIIENGIWVCRTYNIPPVLIPDTKPGRRGLAHHRMGIDGNFPPPPSIYTGRISGGVHWSSSGGKVCPGDRRIKQFVEIVVPAIRAGVEGERGVLDMNEKELRKLIREEVRTVVMEHKIVSVPGQDRKVPIIRALNGAWNQASQARQLASRISKAVGVEP